MESLLTESGQGLFQEAFSPEEGRRKKKTATKVTKDHFVKNQCFPKEQHISSCSSCTTPFQREKVCAAMCTPLVFTTLSHVSSLLYPMSLPLAQELLGSEQTHSVKRSPQSSSQQAEQSGPLNRTVILVFALKEWSAQGQKGRAGRNDQAWRFMWLNCRLKMTFRWSFYFLCATLSTNRQWKDPIM